MKPTTFCIVFTMLSGILFSQNRSKEVYKRWIYLDKNWNTITDTSDYGYKRLTTIEGETNIHPMGAYGKSGYTLKKSSDSGNNDSKILNGTYTWYDESGSKKSEHVFLNGELKCTKEFRKNGKVKTQFEYPSFPNEKEVAFFMYEYNKDMTILQVSEVKKNEKGNWPVMH